MMMKNSYTIGIIGGGQLAMMMAESALKNKQKVIILEPNQISSCDHLNVEIIRKSYNDPSGLSELFSKADIVSYEFENIDQESLETINKESNKCKQGTTPLYISCDRLIEKIFLNNAGLLTAPFFKCDSEYDLAQIQEITKLPLILKTRKFGYDGKGQVRLSYPKNLSQQKDALKIIEKQPCIIEEQINFTFEVSVIGIIDGNNIKPLFFNENIHKNGILVESFPLSKVSLIKSLKKEFIKFAKKSGTSGIWTIEFFVHNGKLIANETAPRVHNSGHHTRENFNVSQFDAIIYFLLKKPIPVIKTKSKEKYHMFNVLGYNYSKYLAELSNDSDIIFTDYFKKEEKENRKMAHFVVKNPHKIELWRKRLYQ